MYGTIKLVLVFIFVWMTLNSCNSGDQTIIREWKLEEAYNVSKDEYVSSLMPIIRQYSFLENETYRITHNFESHNFEESGSYGHSNGGIDSEA
ncbi:MAG: hypothetical protein ACI8ZX_003099 [Planctomycetota bacterium]|jgi:hypothetical protein